MLCVCGSDDHYPPHPLPRTVKVLGTNSPDTNEDKKRCEVRQEAVVTVIRPLTSVPDLHPCDVHRCDHGVGACAAHLSTGKGDKLRAFTTCHSCREWTTTTTISSSLIPPPSRQLAAGGLSEERRGIPTDASQKPLLLRDLTVTVMRGRGVRSIGEGRERPLPSFPTSAVRILARNRK